MTQYNYDRGVVPALLRVQICSGIHRQKQQKENHGWKPQKLTPTREQRATNIHDHKSVWKQNFRNTTTTTHGNTFSLARRQHNKAKKKGDPSRFGKHSCYIARDRLPSELAPSRLETELFCCCCPTTTRQRPRQPQQPANSSWPNRTSPSNFLF